MTQFELRPYQREAVSAVIAARKQGLRRILVCLPTGAGKTVIFSRLAQMAQRPVLVLAHRSELLDQARDKLLKSLPEGSKVEIEQASSKASPGAKAVVASIRSLRSERIKRLRESYDFGLIIYDECHHAAAEDNMRVLRELGAFEPDWPGTLLGVTATTSRGDRKGLDEVFQEIVYSAALPDLINDGYLVPLKGYRIATAADLSEVTMAGEDFETESLAEAVDIEERNALVARSLQELARDRRSLVFCVTVAHARNLARALQALGMPADVIHGELDKKRRARVLERFRAGELRALTNVAVLTEGFDDPAVSCVAMARPTRSEGLYAQCVGRATRLFPGKSNALILDFVDLSQLSLVTLPSLFGMPADLQLAGDEVLEAAEDWRKLLHAHPGFEVEPGEITLAEIKARAQSFDPVSLTVHDEVLAISANAWISLGSSGLALFCHMKKRELSEILVLDSGGRGRRYIVQIDGKIQERFSSAEEAVEAVDYEIGRRGPAAMDSARPGAPWRHQAVPDELAQKIKAQGLTARSWSEALQREVFQRYARMRAPKKSGPSLKARSKGPSKPVKN